MNENWKIGDEFRDEEMLLPWLSEEQVEQCKDGLKGRWQRMDTLTLETATRGTIIIGKCSNERYLIFYHDREKKSLHCLAKDFNVAYLGTDWIDSYLIEEKIDIDRLLADMKGERE